MHLPVPIFESSRERGRFVLRLGMPTIAVVDDDKETRDLLTDLLESEGYEVLSYADGIRALGAFETRPLDLAILDIRMPEMDGRDLLPGRRQRSAMPVLFMTGWVVAVDELAVLRVGADDFVHKPFSGL